VGDGKLVRSVHEAYRKLRVDFSNVGTAAQLNRFVENFIGPMEVRSDGSVGPKTPVAPAEAEATVNSNIAGARYVPRPILIIQSIQTAFWNAAA
jgi:hypothetical protein